MSVQDDVWFVQSGPLILLSNFQWMDVKHWRRSSLPALVCSSEQAAQELANRYLSEETAPRTQAVDERQGSLLELAG